MNLLQKILHTNQASEIVIGELRCIPLENTRSGLIKQNNDSFYGYTVTGLAGLFRKDRHESLVYGRSLCDEVKIRFNCHGFFTTDELPRYGISRQDLRYIRAEMNMQPIDLGIILAYPYALSVAIRAFLTERFEFERSQTTC